MSMPVSISLQHRNGEESRDDVDGLQMPHIMVSKAEIQSIV
jgi:hypothetical protein